MPQTFFASGEVVQCRRRHHIATSSSSMRPVVRNAYLYPFDSRWQAGGSHPALWTLPTGDQSPKVANHVGIGIDYGVKKEDSNLSDDMRLGEDRVKVDATYSGVFMWCMAQRMTKTMPYSYQNYTPVTEDELFLREDRAHWGIWCTLFSETCYEKVPRQEILRSIGSHPWEHDAVSPPRAALQLGTTITSVLL